MSKLRILIVSSEVAPFARTGGLGDVVGALPQALAGLGHQVKVCLPRYRTVDGARFRLRPVVWSKIIQIGGRKEKVASEQYRDERTGVDYYFIDNSYYFNRPELYRDQKTGKDYIDNDERFVFFNRGVLELTRHLEWRPDVIHVHDWQAALIPALLRTAYSHDTCLGGARTVLTIHNLGYQGQFKGSRFRILDMPDEYNYAVTGPLEFFGKVNFLKAGIVLADAVTTVSPNYAREIATSPEFGCGLEDVLQQRGDALAGILNGVDYSVWSPSRDKEIPSRYSLNNLSGKRSTRVELMRKARLPIREKVPLIGMISRLADQKGWDLIAGAARNLFAMDLQMIVLGTGDTKYHRLLQKLEKKYPDKLKAFLTFDDTLAHWIEAGSDMFLMPSRYEPCGLNQMYSLKYGTVPIVRQVGGLADTVSDYNEETADGTGFVFREYKTKAMIDAVRRALVVFAHSRKWTRLLKAGMALDHSWENSARQYAGLFERVTSKRQAQETIS